MYIHTSIKQKYNVKGYKIVIDNSAFLLYVFLLKRNYLQIN